jgi:hypothetical protein
MRKRPDKAFKKKLSKRADELKALAFLERVIPELKKQRRSYP